MEKKRRLGLHEVHHPGGSGKVHGQPHTVVFVDADASPPPRRRFARKPNRHASKINMAFILLSLAIAVGILGVYPTIDLILQAQKTVPPPKQHKGTVVTQPTVQLTTVQIQASQQKSVEINTSGHTHLDATYAHGTLVFYNSAPRAQTVSRGMAFSGPGGMQVVLLQTVLVPAGNLPDIGEASGQAQAAAAGHTGNIPANGINGLCSCGTPQLAVKNLAFSGGQDSQDYSYLSQKDLDQTSLLWRTQVGLEALAKLEGEVVQHHPVSVNPSVCNANISSNQPVGTKTSKATVIIEVVCEQTITVQQT